MLQVHDKSGAFDGAALVVMITFVAQCSLFGHHVLIHLGGFLLPFGIPLLIDRQ